MRFLFLPPHIPGDFFEVCNDIILMYVSNLRCLKLYTVEGMKMRVKMLKSAQILEKKFSRKFLSN